MKYPFRSEQSKNTHFVIGTIVFLIISAVIWTESLMYSQNTLYNNGNWVVTQGGTLQSSEVLVHRAFLAGNTLNLDVQNGHEEVETKNTKKPVQISFQFMVHDDAYLDFYFDRASSRSTETLGFRFSGDPLLPSLFFRGVSTGRFESIQPLETQRIETGWHRVDLVQNQQDLIIKLDQEVTRIPNVSLTDGALAFRSSFFGARIKSVDVDYFDGTKLHETFRNSSRWWKVFQLNLFFVAVIFFLILLINFFTRSRSNEQEGASHLRLGFRYAGLFLTAAMLWFSFDFLEASRWTPPPADIIVDLRLRGIDNSTQPWDFPAEHIRYSIFRFWNSLSGGESPTRSGLDQKFLPTEKVDWTGLVDCKGKGKDKNRPNPCAFSKSWDQLKDSIGKSKTGFRVVVIGGSMTVGYSANNFEETFLVRFHRALLASGLSYSIETINLSEANYFWNTFQSGIEKIPFIKPDAVVVSGMYSVNLGRSSERKEQLSKWIRDIQKTGVHVIFLSPFRDPGFTRAQSQGIPLLDWWKTSLWPLKDLKEFLGLQNVRLLYPEELLNTPKILNSGLIWRQPYHLSSYGQEILADWLAPQVAAILNEHQPLFMN